MLSSTLVLSNISLPYYIQCDKYVYNVLAGTEGVWQS